MTRSRAEVLFVLLTLQAALALLGAVGLLLFMGSALYLAGSVLKGTVLFVLATKIVRGREWALVLTIAVEWVALLAVWAGVLLGLLPMFTPSMTMTGLLTEVGLPVPGMWGLLLQIRHGKDLHEVQASTSVMARSRAPESAATQGAG